ncbi:unnamed protein product, partial [Discosporangium mesarthrocarpum]
MDPPLSRQVHSPCAEMKGAQHVLQRMTLNSPPPRADNPRDIKRVKLFGGGPEAPGMSVPTPRANLFAHASDQTPVKRRPPRMALDAPSPMPSWGGGNSLREASAGDVPLEAVDPSCNYALLRPGSPRGQGYGEEEGEEEEEEDMLTPDEGWGRCDASATTRTMEAAFLAPPATPGHAGADA